MKRIGIVLVTLLGAVSARVTVQERPNFSGEWTRSQAKSDFGPLGVPTCDKLKITHNEPVLILEEAGSGAAPCGLKIRYTTDGAVVAYQVNGASNKGRATWLGTAIVTERVGGEGVTPRTESVLSAEGNVLTRATHVETPQGSADWVYVYDRVR